MIIAHVDEAPWHRGAPGPLGVRTERGAQFIGDWEKGPWIHINSLPAGVKAQPHSHSQDEVIFILEGELAMGGRTCGPGTVVFMERDTQYGFTVGPRGVRFLNIRRGLATFTTGGVTTDTYRLFREAQGQRREEG